MSDPMLAMVLDVEVARHKREVAAGFADLRKSWESPKREPSAHDRYLQSLMGLSAITDPLRLAQMSYSPYAPMNQYMASQSGCSGLGLLDGLFGNAYQQAW